jgi:hypothetical protein
MKSIIQRDMESCYICGSTQDLHLHHVIFGTANRKNSDKYGLTVRLCQKHHTGAKGVHANRELDLFLKRNAQQCFEERIGNREMFREIFGKSWL